MFINVHACARPNAGRVREGESRIDREQKTSRARATFFSKRRIVCDKRSARAIMILIQDSLLEFSTSIIMYISIAMTEFFVSCHHRHLEVRQLFAGANENRIE